MAIEESFKNLNKIIDGAKVLCVPIVSSINRKTNKYKLDCDGNVNRIITTFSHANSFKKLTILLPSEYESMNVLNKFKKQNKSKVTLVHTPYFGKHAGEQRSLPDCYLNTLNLIKDNYSDYDWIFVESQHLAKELVDSDEYSNKLIFYNNVCEIEVDGETKTRSFMNGYNDLNKFLAKHCQYTITVSPETTEYWKNFIKTEYPNNQDLSSKVLNIPYLIDRNLSYFDYSIDKELVEYVNGIKNQGYGIIYLPYRLTDEGYKIDKVIEYINNYAFYKKVCLMYSDPNNSGYLDTIKSKLNDNIKYVKVSTDRNIYYTLLDKCKVNVPYFEDIAFINHATFHEMFNEQANCNIILDKEQTLDKIDDYIYDYAKIPNNRLFWY